MSSCVCKISFKSVQVCGGYCKMFRGGSLFGTQCMSIASTLDLHTVGPNLRRPRVASQQQLSIDICCPRPTSAANPPHAAAAVDRRDTHTRTDRQTDTWPLYDANSIVRGPRNRERKCADTTGTAPVLCAGRFQC